MSCFIFLLFSVIFGVISAHNATTQPQNFFLLSQRQLQSDIAVAGLKINSVEQRANDHIHSITERNRLVLQYIRSYQQALYTLQELNSNHRRCIQHYSRLMVKWGLVEQTFVFCLRKTRSRVNSIVGSARNALDHSKHETNTLLPDAVAICNRTYAKNETRLEECVVKTVDIYSKRAKNNLRLVENNLVSKDYCVLPEIYRDSIQCSFEMESSAIFFIGMVQGLVEKCLDDEIGDFGRSTTSTHGPVNSTLTTSSYSFTNSTALSGIK